MIFSTYFKFLDWVYDRKFFDKKSQTWPRLKHQGIIKITDEKTFYNSAMDVLHAHEEG